LSLSRSPQAKPSEATAARTTPRSSQRRPSKWIRSTGIASSTSLPTTTPRMRAGSSSSQRTRSPLASVACRCLSRNEAETSTIV
jgi:hypothetical protein